MSTEQFNLTGFTKVDIKGAFRFEVVRADAYTVSVDRYWYHQTRVYQQDDVLVVYHPWYDVLGWFTPWITPAVKVAMPALRELTVSGASVGSAKGFDSTQDFKLRVRGASRLTGEINAGNSEIDVAGASRIELAAVVKNLNFKVAGASRISGSLKADKCEIHVAGASRIGLKGSIGDAVIDVAGASRLDLGDLTTRVAGIKIVGASQCAVNVQDKMDAELAGASRLVYGGNPVMGNIRMVGASTMSRK
jgi:hypothetical protein